MIRRFCAYGFLKNLQIFEPFLYVYFLSKGFSYTRIGILISIREISTYVLEIPTGVLADVFGKKESMILCFVSYIVSFIVFGISSGFIYVSMAMILFGLGEAFRTGTHKAIIMDYLELNDMADRKADVYGYTRSWSKIGSAVNAVAAAVIVFIAVGDGRQNYNIIFYASIVPYLAGLVLMGTYPSDRHQKPSGTILEKIRKHFQSTLRVLMKNIRLILNSTLFDGVFKVSRDYIQPIVVYSAVSLPLVNGLAKERRDALIIGAVYFAVSLISAYFARNSRRFSSFLGPSNRTADIVFAGAGLCYILLGFFQYMSIVSLVITVFLCSVAFFNLRRPLIVAKIGERVEKKMRATVYSVESMCKTCIVALLAPALGWCADEWDLFIVFVLCGAGLLLWYLPLKLKTC